MNKTFDHDLALKGAPVWVLDDFGRWVSANEVIRWNAYKQVWEAEPFAMEWDKTGASLNYYHNALTTTKPDEHGKDI